MEDELERDPEEEKGKFDSKGLFYNKVTLETDNMPVGHIK